MCQASNLLGTISTLKKEMDSGLEGIPERDQAETVHRYKISKERSC